MHIRRATESDIPHILRLVAQLDYEVENEAGEAGARAVLADPACVVLLAEEQGQVVGLVSFHIVPQLHHAAPVLTLDELVVAEGARGAGIGAELLKAAVDHARAAGCAVVDVTSAFRRTRAHQFYEAHGFVRHGIKLVLELARSDS
ncbi:MAG: GNAT family N-acetyltransferase [Anaerolineae bacterium]|jgi:GNAT superfamily N-acetyltransferase|nr:GNAT family N-acetyltransferase [Anaerolineae bacterium]MDH7474647.1 GNAT family N-acetyltransferase [Anaerolineae bacterium]